MMESMSLKLIVAYGELRERLSRQDGQALVEYALIVSLIAIVAVAALALTGRNVTQILSNIGNDL
jgi:pilus assembly protein Flp/PilA